MEKSKEERVFKEVLIVLLILFFIFIFLSNYAKIFEFSSSAVIDAASVFDIFAVAETTSVSITINSADTTPPDIFLDFPENTTYYKKVSLNFTVLDDNEIDTIYYNLDNNENITLTQNITIHPDYGDHILRIFANDTNGNLNDSTSVSFFMEKNSKTNYTEFSGDTTDLEDLNDSELEELQNLTLDNREDGKIIYGQNLNLSGNISLDNLINISFNRIEVDSDSLSELNKLATLNLYNLTFTDPRILRDGVVCSSNICNEDSYSNGNLVFTVTGFSVYTTEETPTVSEGSGSSGGSSGGSGGSGGGTTGRVIENVKVLAIDQKLFNVQLKKGDQFKQTIKIKNTANYPIEVNLEEQDNLEDIIGFEESIFTINPLEEKGIEILINTGSGILPGIYIGEIYAHYNDITEKIQAIIEVESVKTLFDVALDIPLDYKKILPGKEFRIQATIFDISGLSSDVNIEFFIRNSKGNNVIRESQVVRVQNQATFTKTFLIPEDTPLGEYIVGAVVKYKDSVGTATKRFDVINEKGLIEVGIPNIFYYIIGGGIVIVLLTLIGVYLLQQKRLKNIEKVQAIRLKEIEKKVVQTPEEKESVNKKLETELILLEKSYKSGYLTKEAYLRSKSKIERLMK